jgi:hypothetical protein
LKYEVFIEKAAQRSLAKVPQPYQDRLIAAVAGLSDDPRPAGAKKLAGREAWRIASVTSALFMRSMTEIAKCWSSVLGIAVTFTGTNLTPYLSATRKADRMKTELEVTLRE